MPPEGTTVRPDALLGQCTHVGMVRTENQDALGYWEPSDDDVFARKGRLVVVCDGMGGAAGGQLASKMAVETIIAGYADGSGEEPARDLWASVCAANKTVYGHAVANPELRGMGTTVTAVAHLGDEAVLAHVGDSRIYLLRGGAIEQLTRDHSLVQQMVDRGELAPEEAELHEDKNVLMRSLGPTPDVEVEVSAIECFPGDTFLLCSDGLTGLVADEEILRIAQAGFHFGYPLDTICKQLVDLANAYAGHDNTTVQLLHLVASS